MSGFTQKLVGLGAGMLGSGAPNFNPAAPTLQANPVMPSMTSADVMNAGAQAAAARLMLAQRGGRMSTMLNNVAVTDPVGGAALGAAKKP